MVTADGQGAFPTAHGVRGVIRKRSADIGDRGQSLVETDAHRRPIRQRDVAGIPHSQIERRESFGEVGDAKGGRAHVDAATAGTQVQWNADDADRCGVGAWVTLAQRGGAFVSGRRGRHPWVGAPGGLGSGCGDHDRKVGLCSVSNKRNGLSRMLVNLAKRQ